MLKIRHIGAVLGLLLLPGASVEVFLAASPAMPAVRIFRFLPASDCSVADIEMLDAAASSGDTIECPSGSATWSSTVNLTKLITLKGPDCTVESNEYTTGFGTITVSAPSTGDCPMVITDGITGTASLLEWQVPACTYPCDYVSRLAHFEFVSGGNRAAGGYGIFQIIRGGTMANDGRQFRVDHLYLNDIPASGELMHFWVTVQRGLFDHNRQDYDGAKGNIYFIYPIASGGQISQQLEDDRWAADINFGGDDWIFFESNEFIKSNCSGFNTWMTDGVYLGGKQAFRKNHFQATHINSHGSEERERGSRGWEVIDNAFTPCVVDSDPYMAYFRSGSAMVGGNATTANFGSGASASLVNYRSTTREAAPWMEASGVARADVNHESNPIVSTQTVASFDSMTRTVTVTGANYGTLTGYQIHKLNCIEGAVEPCSSHITSNTMDTITFATNIGGTFTNLDFSMGDEFEVNRVVFAMDSPCRGGGTLGQAPYTGKALNSLVYSMGVVTAGTLGAQAHNLTAGDLIFISTTSYSQSSEYPYNGQFEVASTPTSSTFTFVPIMTPTGNDSVGWLREVPPAFNDQVTEGCFSFSNLRNGSVANFDGLTQYPDLLRENELVFNDKTATWAGVGIYVGSSLPGTCTENQAYAWDTNAGTWDNGGGGALYKCTSTNTFTPFYEPYNYPHPLTAGDNPAAETRRPLTRLRIR